MTLPLTRRLSAVIFPTLFAGFVASPATALSCMFPANEADLIWTAQFQFIGPFDAAPAIGVLDFVWPRFDSSEVASFTIRDVPFEAEVYRDGAWRVLKDRMEIRGSCINGDCGYAMPGQEILFSLYQDWDGTFFTLTEPCGALPAPSSDTLRDGLAACLDQGGCAAPPEGLQ